MLTHTATIITDILNPILVLIGFLVISYSKNDMHLQWITSYYTQKRMDKEERKNPNEHGVLLKPLYITYMFLTVSFSVGFAELGKQIHILHGHPQFPSGHETFAVSLSTCLIIYNKKSVWFVIPSIILMAWGLIYKHYHDMADIAGALLLGIIIPIITYWVMRGIYKHRLRYNN